MIGEQHQGNRNALLECGFQAQIQLQDDEAVSNMHARIFLKGNNWWVEDLQSTNGTLINQDPIATPTIITTGDQISCGKTIIEITVDDNSGPSEI